MPDEAESEAQSIAVLEATKKEPRLSIYLGLLPVLVFLVLVIGLWLFPPSLVIFEPEFLLPAFNSFLFLSAAIIAIIALRSYLLSGSSTVLWFGCGVLTLGTGALAAGWLMAPFGPNVNVTIFNVGSSWRRSVISVGCWRVWKRRPAKTIFNEGGSGWRWPIWPFWV